MGELVQYAARESESRKVSAIPMVTVCTVPHHKQDETLYLIRLNWHRMPGSDTRPEVSLEGRKAVQKLRSAVGYSNGGTVYHVLYLKLLRMLYVYLNVPERQSLNRMTRCKYVPERNDSCAPHHLMR